VLGYSTVQFGLMTATMTVMSVVGAYGGQAVVTRTGFRPVAATGMVLVGVAFVLLAQVSVDGSFLGDIFFVLLIFGTGLGSAFVASQIAALAGVAERESGLAAGLVDTSFSMGWRDRARDSVDGGRCSDERDTRGRRAVRSVDCNDRRIPVRVRLRAPVPAAGTGCGSASAGPTRRGRAHGAGESDNRAADEQRGWCST
jgi:hypothetical protein